MRLPAGVAGLLGVGAAAAAHADELPAALVDSATVASAVQAAEAAVEQVAAAVQDGSASPLLVEAVREAEAALAAAEAAAESGSASVAEAVTEAAAAVSQASAAAQSSGAGVDILAGLASASAAVQEAAVAALESTGVDAAAVAATAAAGAATATSVATNVYTFLTTTEPAVLAYDALGAIAVAYLTPPLAKAGLDAARGYAGACRCPTWRPCRASPAPPPSLPPRAACPSTPRPSPFPNMVIHGHLQATCCPPPPSTASPQTPTQCWWTSAPWRRRRPRGCLICRTTVRRRSSRGARAAALPTLPARPVSLPQTYMWRTEPSAEPGAGGCACSASPSCTCPASPSPPLSHLALLIASLLLPFPTPNLFLMSFSASFPHPAIAARLLPFPTPNLLSHLFSPRLPAADKLLELPYVCLDGSAGELRSVSEVEAEMTAVQVANLRRASPGKILYMLDGEGAGPAKAGEPRGAAVCGCRACRWGARARGELAARAGRVCSCCCWGR